MAKEFYGSFEKPKKAKKKKPKNNKRITEYIPCERCQMYPAVETNEVFEGNFRQWSIKHKAQEKVCMKCHKLFHKGGDFYRLVKSEHQERIMRENNLKTKQDWFDYTATKLAGKPKEGTSLKNYIDYLD